MWSPVSYAIIISSCKMIKKSAESDDLYKECLKAILSFYDVQIDLEGLINGIPMSEGGLREDDLKPICDKIDFKLQCLKTDFGKISKFNVPLILLMEQGPCLYFPDTPARGRFIFPDSEIKDMSVQDMAAHYLGQVLILTPRQGKGSLDASHMKQGHSLDWFWSPITSFWGQYLEVVLCSAFINLLALAVPLFTLNVYDRVVVNFAEDTLIVLTAGVIVALVFDFLFRQIRSYILERLAARISVKHDYDLMERMIHVKDVDMTLSSGEKASIFHELHSIRDFYASRLIPMLVDIPFFFLFLFVIHIIAPPLVVAPVVAAILIMLINFAAQFPVNRTTHDHFVSMQGKSTVLLDILSGASMIKILNAAGQKLLRWQLAVQNASDAAFKNNISVSVVSNLTNLVSRSAYVSVIFLGAYQIEQGALTIGGLIACSIIFSQAMAPVTGFSGIIARLRKSSDVLKAIDRIFQLPHGDIENNKQGSKGPFKGEISIDDLSYQYPGQARAALYKLNINIKAGERVGIIGQTGAGKTTLSKVIAGLVTPGEGGVFLDGFIYTAITDAELHRTIGYVPQDAHYFNGTIWDNITMGTQGRLREEALRTVIEMSGLNLVMQQTGEGLDMEVGEGGKKLSGGQKQAVSLARALIREPQVLVFDEPTTGMDSALEERVKRSLTEFIEGRTFIMVTHRTSLLSLVDRLILLDKGKLVADGPRDEILQKIAGR